MAAVADNVTANANYIVFAVAATNAVSVVVAGLLMLLQLMLPILSHVVLLVWRHGKLLPLLRILLKSILNYLKF